VPWPYPTGTSVFPFYLPINPRESYALFLVRAYVRILSCPLYTLKRLPRKKPTSVIPNRRATSTAKLLGAEIAHTIGTPAVKHFCRISKLLRPLTMTIWSLTDLCVRN